MQDVLRGVKVVEVAQWWFTPSAGVLLGEWGADVIKIEHPEYGDPLRGLATSGAMPGAFDMNFMLEQCNHGKRSIGLDLASDEGRKVLYQLIEQADVFVTSFLPDVRRRHGLEVEDIRAVNPKIIYAHAHGAGGPEPRAKAAASMPPRSATRGGVCHHLTPTDATSPVMPRPSFGDGIGGLSLAGAVAAALFGCERHGEPSVIDVSLLGTAAWVMGPDVVATTLMPGGIPTVPRQWNANPLSNCYRTADDRWVWLAMLQADRHWPEFCTALDRPELIVDERFASAAARAQNLDACMGEIEAAFASRPLAEWRERLAEVKGAWSVVRTATELLEDPQLVANGYVTEVEYGEQRHRLVVGPAQFDGRPPVLRPTPGPGEQTDEILQELGTDWDAIVELKLAGTIT